MRIFRTSVIASLAGAMLVAICGCSVRGSQETANQNGDEPVATVTYCQLLKDRFRGDHEEVVRVLMQAGATE